MIEIKSRRDGSVIFKSDTATTIAEAIAEMVAAARERGERLNLSDSNLSGSDLSGSDLSYSDLSDSNLSDSNLSDSNLSGSDLSGSDLSYSDLSGSNLRGSNLSGSNLRGSDIASVGFDSRGYHFLLRREDQLRITAGCRRFTLAEAREHWSQRHESEPMLRAEILARLDFAEALATALGWTTESPKAA